MDKVKELRVSDGTIVKVMPKKTNIGLPVNGSADGKLIQFRADLISYLPERIAVFEILRGIWTAMFGENEAESLLNQFKKEYNIER